MGFESSYERWEYHTEFVEAEASQAAAYLALRYPGTTMPKYAVQAVLPRLNELGEEGWELVHMEPVKTGTNADVLMVGSMDSWTHTYLCVFKRRKRF